MSTAVPPPDKAASSPEHTAPAAEQDSGYDARSVVARQKERFGGLKFGATFFGWLAAAGAGVLMTALLASLGAGIGLSSQLNPDQVTGNAGTIGIISAVVLLVVIFIAYFCGGYVAGRMARFNGAKQGVGVWLWAIIAAVVVAVLAAITGSQIDASRYLDGGVQIPVSPEALTASGIIASLAVLVVALVGAVVGGLSGMRFHRRVDRAG
jgi:membrane protease YdiL (CAAX protease family)